MRVSKSEFDAIIRGTAVIAKIEATKAAAPLHNEIAALKAELFAIKDAIRQMREQQALAARTPAAVRARYDAIQ